MGAHKAPLRRSCLIAAPLVLGLAGAAGAQTCHSLSGVWRFDRAGSLMGSGLSFNPTYAVSDIGLTLDQAADGSVQERWRMVGPHVQEVDAFRVQPDGQARPTHLVSVLDTTPEAVSGEWLNCTLVVKARTHLFGQEIWTQNVYLVAPDGRRLTIVQTSHSNLGDVERRLVFEKTRP